MLEESCYLRVSRKKETTSHAEKLELLFDLFLIELFSSTYVVVAVYGKIRCRWAIVLA